jgi:hypothetical protein
MPIPRPFFKFQTSQHPILHLSYLPLLPKPMGTLVFFSLLFGFGVLWLILFKNLQFHERLNNLYVTKIITLLYVVWHQHSQISKLLLG